jgi:hypothetical protein
MKKHKRGRSAKERGWSSDKKSNTQRGRRGMERTCRTDAAGARVQVHRAGTVAGTREREQQRSGMEQQGAATSTNTAQGRNQVQLQVGCRCTERSTCRERERHLQGLRSGASARDGAEQVQGTERSRSRCRERERSRSKSTGGFRAA